jgi:hypothetical protein
VTTLTVAFADHIHAELAVTFPRDAVFEIRAARVQDGTERDYEQPAFTVAAADVERLRTFLAGVQGIVLEERHAVDGAVA